MLPVHLDKTDIVVMNEVCVRSPYHSKCVIGGTPAANGRVRKVLEMLRKSFQLTGSGH
ncbi:LSM12-like protein, partial [Trifolium medium]|nr:LSM12-like protein [Trifolium medium]